MRFLPLILRSYRRSWIRTTFTFACIAVAFALYGVLMVVRYSFTGTVDLAGVDRIWTYHKVSIIQMIPVAYLNEIQAIPGVTAVTDCTWFGGQYQNEPIQFAFIATDVEQYLKLYPEFKVPPDQLKALLADRQGILVGRATADRYHWKIGDRVPVLATIWQPTSGQTWYFNVDAIYDGGKDVDKTQAMFRYDYFDENRRNGKGTVSWYVIRVDNPERSAAISASIDAHFENSSFETKTAPEKAVFADFAKQTGDIGAMLSAILIVVLFTILLIVANTMAQSVRERTSEIGVLKTLGFSNGTVLSLVLIESLCLSVLGGGAGIAFTWFFVHFAPIGGAFLPVVIFKTADVVLGIVLCLSLGLLAGAMPATGAMRLRIVDALRRT